MRSFTYPEDAFESDSGDRLGPDPEIVAQVIFEVLRRRDAGEDLPDQVVIGEYPELMPFLEERLAAIDEVRRAFLASRRAGPLGPIRILSEAELEAPITVDEDRVSSDTFDPTPAGFSIQGYDVFQELGAGGQGRVFKARQQSTSRSVALKVLLGGSLATSRHRRRFEREIKILARLDHPNLAKVLDRGATSQGALFFVMEFVDGLHVDEYVTSLRRRGDPTQPWAATALLVLAKVARGIHEAHRHGVIHRDLKPSNILVDRHAEPHVVDFGLAGVDGEWTLISSSTALTHTGQVLGSLPWTSPEQIGGAGRARADARSDVYALGLIAYHLLTGEFPYDVEGSMADLTRCIQHESPLPPSRRLIRGNGHLGRAATSPSVALEQAFRPGFRLGSLPVLDRIILRALEKKPEDRYASAADLAVDLERFATGDLPGEPRVQWRWPSRRTLLVAAGTSVAAAALLAFKVLPLRRPVPIGVPASVSTPDFINDLGMRFVWMGPRRYQMGSPGWEAGRHSDEARHLVSLDLPLWIGTTEVTQGQFDRIMKFNPSDPRFIGKDLPVQRVSWDEAVEFCLRLSHREGCIYRLPDEAEWECACRATSGSGRFWSDDLNSIAWYAGNSGGRVHHVATKAPNGWGLYDVHGNVAEWCRDAVTPTATQPMASGRAGESAGAGVVRIIRGGAADRSEADCRAAARDFMAADARNPFVGFRVVCERPRPPAARASIMPSDSP